MVRWHRRCDSWSLDDAKQVYVQNPVPDLRPVEALKARIYLHQGRLDRARVWATARGLAHTDAASYLREFELLTLARLQSAELEVNHLLARLLYAAEAQKRMGSVLEILLTQALAYAAQDNRPQTLASLARALTLAEPEGYRRSFVDEGEELRLLLLDFIAASERKPGASPLLGYVDSLVAAFAPTASSPAQAPSSGKQPALVEPLSERELEVLRLIALGLSNGEISQRLFLALSSVKGHNLRIFGKLQVQNRTEAVARARVLGLPIYLTTSSHSFLEMALRQAGRDPQTEICRWRPGTEARIPPVLAGGCEPSKQKPLVYHLYGLDADPNSLVLTEDDYLNYLVAVTENFGNEHDPVHKRIRLALAESSLLLLGYRLRDWETRTLFRGLIVPRHRLIADDPAAGVVNIQLKPDAIEERYLNRYLETTFLKEASHEQCRQSARNATQQY